MLPAAALAFAVAAALQPLVIATMRRRGRLDVPSDRGSHQVPTPRGGGIAVVLGVLSGAAFLDGSPELAALVLATALAALVGLAEDLHGVAVPARFLLLCVSALPLAAMAGQEGSLVLAPLVLVYAVAVVNAVNFMDGVNGISAVQGIAGGGAYAVAGHLLDEPALTGLGLLLAVSCAAFLPYNAPRARVFLGDVGSYGLGAALAGLSVLSWLAGAPLEAAVAPLALYLADTGTTLLRRVRAGEPWHLPHRTHCYQRLIDLGWSHTRVSLLVLGLVLVCSALGGATAIGTGPRVLADLALGAVLTGYLLLPRVLGRSLVSS